MSNKTVCSAVFWKIYRKCHKYSDTQIICCNHSKIWTMWLYDRAMSSNDADGKANSVDPDQQSGLGLHCLLRPICPKLSIITESYRGSYKFMKELIIMTVRFFLLYDHDGIMRLCYVPVIKCYVTWSYDFHDMMLWCWITVTSYEPCHEKTCLQDLWPVKTQTSLLSWWDSARVLKFRLQQVEVLYYPGSEQQRHWSDYVGAQNDLRLCCLHIMT